MRLHTKPLIISLVVVFGITIATFLITSSVRYTSPTAVFNYIKTRPLDVAISCQDPEHPENGFFAKQDEPFPLAATIKLVVLAAYADEVAAGQLDPQEQVSIKVLDQYYLPGTDGGAHPEFIKTQVEQRETISLDEVVGAMTSYGSNAAMDYLISRLDQADYNQLYQKLGLARTDKPSTFLALYLFINNHETGMYAEEQLSPEEIQAEESRLVSLYLEDEAWRQAEINFISKPTNAAPLKIQQMVIDTYGVKGSASDMSRVLLAAYGYNNNLSPQAQTILQRHLEWPMRMNPDNTKSFDSLASVSGAWPGILTSAWQAKNKSGASRILVVLYRNVPDDFWNTWISTFSHQQFETQVLSSADCNLFPPSKQ